MEKNLEKPPYKGAGKDFNEWYREMIRVIDALPYEMTDFHSTQKSAFFAGALAGMNAFRSKTGKELKKIVRDLEDKKTKAEGDASDAKLARQIKTALPKIKNLLSEPETLQRK